MKRNYIRIICPLSIILFFFVLIIDLKLFKMWAFADINAFPTDHSLIKDWILYSWKEEGLGTPNTQKINYYIITFLSSSVFGSFLGQKILFLSIFPISFLSFYYLSNSFKFRQDVSLLGSLFYSFNPVIIASFIGGSIEELMTFSLLPLFIIYVYILILEKKFSIRYLAILALITFFLLNQYVTFWYTVLTIPIILILSFRRYKIKNLLRFIPLILLMSMIYLPTLFGFVNMNKGISENDVSFGYVAKYTYGDMSIQNILRLSGNRGSAQAEEFLDYNRLNKYTFFGYVLSLATFLSIFFMLDKKIRDEDDNIKFLSLYGLFSSITIIFILLLIKNYPNLIDESIILSSLRNPVKLMYPLVFSFAILFSCSINILFDRIYNRRCYVAKTVTISILIFSILFYNYPAIDGTLGLKKIRDNQYFIDDKYYQLTNIMKNIDIDYKQGNILFLPWEYIMNLRIRSEIPNYFGTSLEAEIYGVEISKFKEIFEIIRNGDDNERNDILSSFNIRYIIIDKTFKSDLENLYWYKKDRGYYDSYIYKLENSYWLTGDPIFFYSLFRKDNNLMLVYNDANFAIFKNNIEDRKFFITYVYDNQSFITNYRSNNMVENPSFEYEEKGWSSWPRELIFATSDSKNNKFLSIHGQEKWWTNVNQIISIKQNKLYQLNFSVKGSNITDMHAKLIWYNQTKKLGEEDGYISDYIMLYDNNLIEDEWYDFKGTFASPKDAILVRIQFLGNRLKDYQNASMSISDISFYEISPKIGKLPQIKKIDYDHVSPTLYKIRINDTEPVILSFMTSYSPLWEAMIYKNGSIVKTIKSTYIYPIINNFIIDDTGNFEIIIRYKPQYWYYISLTISIVMSISCIGYLFYDWRAKKNGNKK